MDLNLTTDELRTVITEAGFDVPRDIDGVFVGNEARVKILHLKYSHVIVKRIGPKKFSVVPVRGIDETSKATLPHE